MTPRERLLELARALEGAPAVTVPREWLLEALEPPGASQGTAGGPVVDATVKEIATLFGKKPSTIRAWCEIGATGSRALAA
jgi:hypothetical protein